MDKVFSNFFIVALKQRNDFQLSENSDLETSLLFDARVSFMCFDNIVGGIFSTI